MTTDSTGQPVPWWFDIYLRKESQRAEEFEIFIVNKSVVKGMYPAPDIHEHFTIHKLLRQTAYILTHNLNNLEHIANNCMSAMTHTDVTTAHHRARCAAFRCVVVHAFIHRTCGSSLALCVIPCHPCMRTCVWLLECSLFTLSLYFFLKSFFHLFLMFTLIPVENSMEDPPVQLQLREHGQPGLCHTRHIFLMFFFFGGMNFNSCLGKYV